MKDRLLFEQRKNSIRDMIYDPNYIPLKLKEMAYLMDVPHKDRGALKEVMDALVADGSVELTARGKYIKPENQNVTGVFTANARGFGFVTAEGEEEDIFIPATYVNGALHKDVVKVKVTKKTGGEGKRREGMILKILERGCKTVRSRRIQALDLFFPMTVIMIKIFLFPRSTSMVQKMEIRLLFA